MNNLGLSMSYLLTGTYEPVGVGKLCSAIGLPYSAGYSTFKRNRAEAVKWRKFRAMANQFCDDTEKVVFAWYVYHRLAVGDTLEQAVKLTQQYIEDLATYAEIEVGFE